MEKISEKVSAEGYGSMRIMTAKNARQKAKEAVRKSDMILTDRKVIRPSASTATLDTGTKNPLID